MNQTDPQSVVKSLPWWWVLKSHRAKSKILSMTSSKAQVIRGTVELEPAGEQGTLWRFLWWHYQDSSHSSECSVCFVCRSLQCVPFPLKLHLLNQWWHFHASGFYSTKETRKCLALTIRARGGENGQKMEAQWKKEREREGTGQKGISISFLILQKQQRLRAQVINQSYGSCNNEGSGILQTK